MVTDRDNKLCSGENKMKRTEKVLRYSIRKSVLGVSSVLICALFLGHSMVAADEERPVKILIPSIP